MKTFFLAMAAFCAPALLFGAAERRNMYALIMSEANIEVSDATSGVRVVKKISEHSGVRKNLVSIYFTHAENEWRNVSFKITADRDAEVSFSFGGEHKRPNNADFLKIMSLYDNFKIDGKLVQNGDFEDGLSGWLPEMAPIPAGVVNTVGADGKPTRALRAWAKAYFRRSLAAKAGKPVEISFDTRFDRVIPDGCNSEALDISKFANIDAQTDLRKFGAKLGVAEFFGQKRELGGVSFELIDAKKSGGKNAVVLRSSAAPKAPKEISVENPLWAPRLFIMHTSFYKADNGGKNRNGFVLIETKNGESIKYPLRRKTDTWLFEDARDFEANVMPIWAADQKNNLGKIYVSKFDVPRGEIKRISIISEELDTLVIFAASLSANNPPMFKTKKLDPAQWSPIDTPDFEIKPGSALDQSGFFPREKAGDRGRVIISERGTLAFEKTPDEDARFKGFSETARAMFMRYPKPERYKVAAEYCAKFKRMGYNFVRNSYGCGRYKLSPDRDERVDLDDFVVSEFKKNGVYIYNAFFAIPLKENSFHLRDDIKLRALFGFPGARETWRDAAVETLNHVNPYTGIAFKDDPVYACLEIYNELAICYSRFDDNANRDPRDKIRPETKEFIYGKWAKWLEKRYGGDISKLNDAWNARMRTRKKFAFASFKEVPIIVNGNPDWERCCWDFNEEFTRYAKKVLRDGGYKGLIVQNNLGASIYGSGVRSRTSDFVAFNTYFCHPSSFDLQNAKVRQTSSIDGLGAYWKSVATTKIEGRPFGISEYNHCFWNKYRHEMAALFAPYSAFQNFSFLTLHEGAVPLPTAQGKYISFFNIYNSPACRASELLSSAAFIRGDVKKSRKTVRMNVSEKFLRDNPEAVRGFNLKQASVALLSGFVSTYEGEVPEPASGVKPRKPDLEMSPQGSTEFLAEAWFHSAIDNNNKTFDLEKFAEKMRQKGILPKGNKTDIAAGVYQTDTGQITLNQNDMTLTVQTPRTEIIALSKRLDGAAKIIAGARSSVCATVALTSMDGKRLANSSRMTLIYLTREGNMGMNLSYDDVSVAGQSGGVPVLQNGILELNLRLDPKKSYELYALALNGERREKLPTTLQDGLLSIKIDNSRLTHGSTPFYELVLK